MRNFQKILYVTSGVGDSRDALIQALSLTRNNNAELKILILYPHHIEKIPNYIENYKSLLMKQEQEIMQEICAKYNLVASEQKIDIAVESFEKASIQIVQHVLRDAYDLVIKEIELSNFTKGYNAIDMELLRKCPSPVWLCRPIIKHRNEISVAVAIDPSNGGDEAHDLNIRLLKLSRSIADTCNKELKIISCWDYEHEEYIRNCKWISLSEDELQADVRGAQNEHYMELKKIIVEAAVSGKFDLQHLRGAPDAVIPKYVENNSIDILVMGTVARTGIQSFIIGNTAENILQQLSCTLVALKPNGFVTPVKIY